jgi:DNA-binding transcriptional ArsR family regulator
MSEIPRSGAGYDAACAFFICFSPAHRGALSPPLSSGCEKSSMTFRVGISLAPTSLASAMAKQAANSKTARGKQEVIYAMQAEICRVLGHPRRIQILELLAEGEESTAQLLRSLGVGKVNLSQHMALLKQAGLVETLHQGRTTSYRLSFVEIKDACRLIRRVLAARLRRGTKLARSLGRVAAAQSSASSTWQ